MEAWLVALPALGSYDCGTRTSVLAKTRRAVFGSRRFLVVAGRALVADAEARVGQGLPRALSPCLGVLVPAPCGIDRDLIAPTVCTKDSYV
jgi:hypothetical protein